MRNNKSSKTIAFAMASVMTMSMVPAIHIHAETSNSLSSGNLSAAKKTMFYEPNLSPAPTVKENSKVEHVAEGNYLSFKVSDDDSVTSKSAFEISLENGKFAFQNWENYLNPTPAPFDTNKGSVNGSTYTRNKTNSSMPGDNDFTMTATGDDVVKIQLGRDFKKDETIRVPLIIRTDENRSSGNVKASVVGKGGISGNTYTIATINGSGSTTVTVEDVQTAKNKIIVNKITIKETVAETMRPKDNDGFYLELPSGYAFGGLPTISKMNVDWNSANYYFSSNNRILYVPFTGFRGDGSRLAGRVVITGLTVIPNGSTNDNVTSEEIKASIGNLGDSDMVSEQDFLIGKRADYGVAYKVNTVPTLTNGYYDTASRTNTKIQTGKLTVSEKTIGSIINGRDLYFELDTGDKDNANGSVKIVGVKIEEKNNIKQAITGTHELGKGGDVEVHDRKVILRGIERSSSDSSDEAKFDISFYVSIESGYVGDIKVKVYGDGIGKDSNSAEQVVIAKAINPINVTPQTAYITPGQTVELGDIVLTEQLNNKGEASLEEGKTVMLGFSNNNNYLSVVGTPTVKTEGGLKVKNIRTTNTNASGSSLSFTIDTQSSKNKASKLTISGLKVAASSSIPQGTYDLVVGGTAIAGNSTAVIGSGSNIASFTSDGIAVAKLQHGGQMKMKITVGDKIAVVNGQNVEMKMAPFIDPETGTTYMQVSDVVKATQRECSYIDTRVTPIEGMEESLFVKFGNRTFQKDKSIVHIDGNSLPESMFNEQGVPVNMIVKDDYTCLPLRYFVEKVLGQKITWNGTDRTITVE